MPHLGKPEYLRFFGWLRRRNYAQGATASFELLACGCGCFQRGKSDSSKQSCQSGLAVSDLSVYWALSAVSRALSLHLKVDVELDKVTSIDDLGKVHNFSSSNFECPLNICGGRVLWDFK